MTPLIIDWSPERQLIVLGEQIFDHKGPVPTRPEHDAAHLMIGWHGGMAWRPQGSRDEVCLAEFNAVHLEVLLAAAGPHPALPSALWWAAGHVLPHMQWFVEQHYAPFPIPLGEALARFWAVFQPERVAGLVPFFWEVRDAPSIQPSDRICRRLDL